MKYQLLLKVGDIFEHIFIRNRYFFILLENFEDILKFTERSGESTELLKKAMQVMHVVPKSCDDMMHVGRLQNFDGKITAQGKLVHQVKAAIFFFPRSSKNDILFLRVHYWFRTIRRIKYLKPKIVDYFYSNNL